MKKKIVLLSIAILLLSIFYMGFKIYKKNETHSTIINDRLISITLKKEEKVIFSKKIKTNQTRLLPLLEEMKKNKIIFLEYKESEFGSYITEIGVNNAIKEDKINGKYWTYSSKNNKQCQLNEFCDAADILEIDDKDEFIFVYGSVN